MPNSDYSRNEYLKALLNASKNNRANEGVLVNPSNTLGNANTDISELAVLDTKLPSKNKVPTTEQIKDVDDRNFWQRTMDSINEFRLNILEGTLNFFGGIVDAGIWLGGAVGNVFGADTEWAQNAMDYDWESQVMNFMNQTNYGQHIYSGDIFQKDYWQNWADMGSAEASRENIDQVHSGSFVSGMGETGQQTYQTITQGVGYILPSVLLAIGTGGASVGVQAAARGVSLGGTMTSAFGSGTNEALKDGADYYKAGASGAVSAAIEGGTEALSFGVGKLVGKVLGKTVSYGTRINGAQFVKGLSKLTAGELGKAALEEGTEELIAELLSPLAKSVYKGGEAFNEYANPELYKQAAIAFAGGAVGGMFGAGVQGTNARIKYGKDGVKALGIISDISQMKQDNVSEFKRGNKADQNTIGQVETMMGEKVKELVSTLDTLKQNDIKSFNNVMEAIKNPNQAIADLEKMKGAPLTADEKIEFKNNYVNDIDSVVKQFQSSTADIVAGQTSSNLTKINGKPTLIQFAKNNEFNQEQHKGSRAFLATDKSGRQLVLINPKYKSNYYQIVAHEAISHGILDTNEHNRNEVIKIIEKEGKLSKEYAKYDSEILDVYQPEISKELGRKVDEKLYKERATQTEVFKREKLARFLESLVHDDKSLNRLLGNKISSLEKGRIKSILNRIKNSLSLSKDAKLIKQINKVVSEITDSQKETRKELQLAYSKTKDSVGNQLSPKQQEYFKDSVVRDENGNLKVVYHGTKADFNTFLHKHISDSTGSMDFGYGFYFTDSELVASGYGTTKSVYLDIKKPLSYDSKTITKADLSKLLKTLDADGEMGILSNFDDVSYIGYQRLLSKAINMLYDNNSNDVDIISEMINIDGGYRASKEFYNILKDTLGYDGIITKYHTKKDDVYVVFNSNQIKSIDNKNPTDSDDIRYSRTSESNKIVYDGDLKIETKPYVYDYIENSAGSVLISSEHGYLEVLKYRDGRASVIEYLVKEQQRGKGVGTKLFTKARELFGDNLIGQFSSPTSASIAYKQGMRATDSNNNELSWEETKTAIDKNSSVYMEFLNKKADVRYSRTFDSAKNKLASEEKRKKIVARLAKVKTSKNIPLAETAIIKNGYQYYVDNQGVIGLQLAKNNYIDGLKDGNELINGHPFNKDANIDRFFNEKNQVKVATIKISDLYSELKSLDKDSKIIMLKVGDHSIAFQRKVLIDAFELAGFETDAKINIYTGAKKLNNFVFAPLLFKNTADNNAVIVSVIINTDAGLPSFTLSNKNPNLPSDIKETLKDQEITPTKVEQPKADLEQADGKYEIIPLFYGVGEYIEREATKQKSSQPKGTQPKAKYDDKVSGVQASKDYAQHMQSRVINMKTTKDVYNIMIDGIASAFGVDIKITNKEVLARQTTIAFNRLLNKPDELNKVVDGIINDILDSKIEYEVKANENQVAITLKDTLRKHLSNLGINVNEFFNDSVSILKDILLDKSNDSKVEKLRNYFQSKIAVLVKLVKQYRNNSYYIVKSFQVHKKINERLKKNKLPRQVGDRHIAELEFYYQATKNIKLSRSAKGISPASIDSIIDGLRGYSPDIAEKLQWLQFNKEIDDARNLLMSSQVNGKFPNRALTLEENIAVYTIMTNIAKDMKMLESETVAQRHKAVEIADEEVKVIAEANKGFKSNVIQNELDAASSVDTIIGRYFGMSSDTYKIMYEDMFNAYNNQLLKQWEFLGEYEKIKEQHKLKDHHFAKRVEFKGSKLSLDILLDMYIQSRTPSGLATLQQGGYSIYEKGNTTHLRLNPQDIITLETIIPSDMRAFGEQVLQDLYNGSIQAYKGDTDERIFGFRNIISETYYPSTKTSSSAKFENENDFKALDPSKTTFNQERLNATKLSLRGMGFSERFKVYTNAITKYGEMTEAIRVFETLTNQFTTREDGTNTTRLTLMAEAIPNFQKYINYYQSQIMGNYVDATKSSSKTFTNIVSFTLAGNLSVVLKQTASIPSIMFEVKFSSWLKAMVGAGGKIAKYGQTKAHLKQISGILAERWGDYNVLKSQVLSNNLSKIAKFFGVPMAKMDEAVIVIFAYSAAEHEAESLGYGKIGTKENENAAVEILNRIVANTQSNAIPIKMSMNRAGANKPIRKFLSYFSSDLQNKVSQINRLLSEAKNAKKQLEAIDNRISKNEAAIEENEAKFNEFKEANNMSGDSTNALAKLDDANAKKFTYFEQEADRLANKQNILKDMKVKKQAIISGGKNAREALKLLFSLFVSGLMISSIEQLMARILGRKGWNENTSGEFAISLLLESTINNLPYVNTITNAIQYKADVGGYDFTLINNMLDFAEDIMTMATNREFELGKIMLNLTHLLGMLTGIPTKNLYNIAMGIWKNVDGGGYQADAIIKGFSDSYMASQFRLAIESNNNKMASGYLDTLLSLYKVGSTNEALQNEMMSLYGDGFNALPKNFMTSYTNEQGKTVELTENQILAFRSVYNTANQDADGLLSINEYKLAMQEDKAKSMSKLYDAYYLYAKAKALNLGKADSRLANLLLYTNGNVDIAKYVIYLSKLGTIVETNRKSKKELTLEYINRLSNLTKQEKILLMVLNGYSVGEKLQNQVLSYLSAKGMSRANAMTFLKIGN